MNHKKTRLILAIMMAVLLMSNSILSFAAPMIFTDIQGHWAKNFIEDVYSRELSSGYPDGSFKPDGDITKLETMMIISKLMGYTENDAEYYIEAYRQVLANNKIPAWAQGATAYALFNDILLPDEVSGLVKDGKNVDAKRYEVVTYIGRVLEHSIDAERDSITVTLYRDEMSIPSIAIPYVDLLLNENILDEESNDRRFLPHNLITRAEVSKLVSLSAEILEGKSGQTEGPKKEPDQPEKEPSKPSKPVSKKVNGNIDNIIIGDKDIISIKTDKKLEIYDIDPDAYITIDGNRASLRDLEKGQPVNLKIEDDLVVEITALIDEEVMEAYFNHYIGGVRPMVYVKDKRGDISSFDFTEGSKVYLMDKAVDIKELRDGDPVTITYKDNEIIEINAEEKQKIFTGVVLSTDKDRKEESIEVLLDDDETVEVYKITKDTNLRRDRRSVDFEDIKVGDELEITMEYDQVVYINAFSVRRNVEGYIRKIDIGDNIKIHVEKYQGDLEEFILTPETTIRIEEVRSGVYDLRLNYEVKLELENNQVVWLDAYKTLQGASYKGRLLHRDSRRGTLEIQMSAREEATIYTEEETIFIDIDGKIIDFRDLNIGDEIVVIGENNGYHIIANRVLVMIRR